MPKVMVFLFDGTANDAATSNAEISRFSNVYAINQMIDQENIQTTENGESRRVQVTFYMPGIGTPLTIRRPNARWDFWSPVRQVVFGDGLEQLVLRAYVNLCANFKAGDEIVLIGFSRGAAAARIFSRFISDFGILQSKMLMLLGRLWNGFVDISQRTDDVEYYKEIRELKNNLAKPHGDEELFHKIQDVDIKFLGLFDTVIGKYDGPLLGALDFRDSYPASKVSNIVHIVSLHDTRRVYELKRFKFRSKMNGTFKEIWMPGVHSDVGGGYRDNFISNHSLLTMSYFLEKLGGLSLNQKSFDNVVEEVRLKARLEQFHINKEPFAGPDADRRGLVVAEDEFHPLHQYFEGKNVYWKNPQATRVYVNNFTGMQLNIDSGLKTAFDEWLNDPRPALNQ